MVISIESDKSSIAFGIFVSSENTKPGVQPLSHIVQQMDAEFDAKLQEIQRSGWREDITTFEVGYIVTNQVGSNLRIE